VPAPRSMSAAQERVFFWVDLIFQFNPVEGLSS
jgi:hypothetical protein